MSKVVDNLPEPLPGKITFRHITMNDPGYLIMESDGHQILILEMITDQEFDALSEEIKEAGYIDGRDWYCDMALTVQHFYRDPRDE